MPRRPDSALLRDQLREAIAAHRRPDNETQRAQLAEVIRELQAAYHKAVADEAAATAENEAVWRELGELTRPLPTKPLAVEEAPLHPASRGLARAASKAWGWLWGDTRTKRLTLVLFYAVTLSNFLRWISGR